MHLKSSRTILYIFVILTLSVMACSFSISELFDTSDPVETQIATEVVISSEAVPTLASQGEALTNLPPVNLISQQDALISLYENVSSGVVSIRVFGTNGDTWQASGFVIDHEGHIVTNFHVATGASEFEVTFTSGLTLRAEAIGFDADSDLAVIKVNPPEEGLNPLVLGDSEQVSVGQIVVAIGNPFGLNSTMTTGIVSGLGRTSDSLNPVDDNRFFVSGDLIQTDAAINPGNSGGPLLNLNGEVLGVNRSIRTFNLNAEDEPINSGIGFAVSVNILKRVIPSLISTGSYDYPYLGIASPNEFSLSTAEALGLDRTTGVLLTEVVEGGPSDEAGLILGDLIISMDEFEVRDFGEMISYLFTHTAPGDRVTITFLRDGEEMQTELVIGTRP
ncbi:MAG: trypsin-like serine protease [Chloroflexi bacterium]|nr:trypsin-like serine protease [Chloroflexota bacterium]